MCITSMVGDFRDLGPPQIIPPSYQEWWNKFQPKIPVCKPQEMSLKDIDDLIDTYLEAWKFDVENGEPYCHDKEKHEELEDISVLLTKRLNRRLFKHDYEGAQKILNLIVKLRKLLEKLDAYVEGEC